jgi:uncharacterized protein (DUF1015 family)
MDSSPVVGPPSVGRPLRLRPFRGWRLTAGRIGDPATARLFARPYRDVTERLARWESEHHLLRDAEPAVYVHEYTAGGLTVRGLVGALDISHRAATPDDRAVFPHEGIHPVQVAELADRMTRWELNPAPILLVHRGPVPVRELVERTLATAPDQEYVDRADQHHRVWAIRDAGEIDALNLALAGSRALIADGHHRYAAYLQMQQAAPGGPMDCGLAMLVDQADTPLFLGAIHRVLLGSDLDELRVACAARGLSLTPVASSAAFGALSQDTLVATDGTAWATLRLPLDGNRAAVEVLHDDLLPALELPARRVTYHHSVDEALSRVRSSRGVAVLMPAPDFDLVTRVALAGRLLPEKATSFQPKPSIGVLIRSLRDGRSDPS